MIEELIRYCGEDFNVWTSQQSKDFKYYNLSIEGYIGYEKLEDCIDLYEKFLEVLYEYLIVNNIEQTDKHRWKRVYQSRAIDISYEHDYYWVFLDTYKSKEIWDLYYYMEDVIKQIESNMDNIYTNRMLIRN